MIVLWLFRWLAFRLMIGAGMSKVGGNSSACWRELTCTETHYTTQPIPNPFGSTLPSALPPQRSGQRSPVTGGGAARRRRRPRAAR